MTELERALAEIELLREENRLLRQKLDYVIRQLYGSKSEKLNPDQLDLFGDLDSLGKPETSGADEAAEALMSTAGPSRPKSAKERKPRLPENLPVEEIILEPEPVKACPEAWRRIGEEVSEELERARSLPAPSPRAPQVCPDRRRASGPHRRETSRKTWNAASSRRDCSPTSPSANS